MAPCDQPIRLTRDGSTNAWVSNQRPAASASPGSILWADWPILDLADFAQSPSRKAVGEKHDVSGRNQPFGPVAMAGHSGQSLVDYIARCIREAPLPPETGPAPDGRKRSAVRSPSATGNLSLSAPATGWLVTFSFEVPAIKLTMDCANSIALSSASAGVARTTSIANCTARYFDLIGTITRPFDFQNMAAC